MILQHNLGRSKVASSELFHYMIQNHILAATIQEPYLYANSIPCPSSFTVISSNSTTQPIRAAIIVSNKAKTVHLQQYSSPDLCVCTIGFKNFKLTLASVYIPPARNSHRQLVSISPYLNSLENIIQHNIRSSILVCGDFNSHHNHWFSDDDEIRQDLDNRGSETADFIASNNLHILNNSNLPTFFAIRDRRI